VVVAKGETLRSIAQHWHTTVTTLMQENNLVREDIDTGTRLKLPLAADER
jgi:LysM repeat protein